MIPTYVGIDSEELMEVSDKQRASFLKKRLKDIRAFVHRKEMLTLAQEDCGTLALHVSRQLESGFPVAYVAFVFQAFPYAEYLCCTLGVEDDKALDVFLDCLATLTCGSPFSPADDFLEVLREQIRLVFADPQKETK